MVLDRPVFEIQHRIKHWLSSLSEEQRSRLRGMRPEDSLRFLFEGIQQGPRGGRGDAE